MNEVINSLASKCGISPEMVQKGLGAILQLLKSKLPPEMFAKISGAIPDADSLLAGANDSGGQSGSLLGSVTGAIGKLFGDGDSATAMAKLGEAGFTPDQLQGFLPKVLEFLKSKLPPEVMEKIAGLLPAAGAAGQ